MFFTHSGLGIQFKNKSYHFILNGLKLVFEILG